MKSYATGAVADVFADPTAYADEDRLHAALTHLRDKRPVAWVDKAPYRPFWAVTKHADISGIERDSDLFISSSRAVLAASQEDDLAAADLEAGIGLRTLMRMDGRSHRKMRAIAADWFRPKALRDLEERVDTLAARYVDRMHDIGPECDFVPDIAVNFPLYVIMSLLGIPERDFPRMLRLTREMVGGDDAEYRRNNNPQGRVAIIADFFQYFSELTLSRRRTPTGDMASAIANARIDGALLSDADAASYYLLIAVAGHDTTKAALSGGLLALIENPGELARLQSDPGLMGTAVEEMIRWSTPVKEFMRTAAADTMVRGIPIAKGESVYLAYASGNRDEEVFDDPFRFDVGRVPNRHLGFGRGVHFCLGAPLARMEMNSLFSRLIPRLDHIELAGRPEFLATTFVGGLKHLPIRYSMR
ncbi:cytochrome P450 [Mycolicibacterium vaccae]|uniref:Steroid C26-monooxygenase n=1 Tax=Mycolicibacterium vaccae ATCC 25954 TaxID=1194972 RepID=K0UTK2_MYCVA|nr:cytochrome P450 [Mycolicibacterium vaccae]ANI40290.1 cytochrome P450 [Mycolicibacterium vaccae 95051]EJZ10126.1 cytochrome P450 [Mycolicibacterium vaccae ATCC 25954]